MSSGVERFTAVGMIEDFIEGARREGAPAGAVESLIERNKRDGLSPYLVQFQKPVELDDEGTKTSSVGIPKELEVLAKSFAGQEVRCDMEINNASGKITVQNLRLGA